MVDQGSPVGLPRVTGRIGEEIHVEPQLGMMTEEQRRPRRELALGVDGGLQEVLRGGGDAAEGVGEGAEVEGYERVHWGEAETCGGGGGGGSVGGGGRVRIVVTASPAIPHEGCTIPTNLSVAVVSSPVLPPDDNCPRKRRESKSFPIREPSSNDRRSEESMPRRHVSYCVIRTTNSLLLCIPTGEWLLWPHSYAANMTTKKRLRLCWTLTALQTGLRWRGK
mmetsp:Transcript_39830/g.119806  ORF Transcript_39830/g.119806 Transcript_39830/m.119806 type:complete len:222 (+) Transcript_39830:761-1426(+)